MWRKIQYKIDMKRSYTIALLVLSPIFGLFAENYKTVTLYEPDDQRLLIHLNLLPDPVHFAHRMPKNEEIVESLPWWPVYKTSFLPSGLSFEEWVALFTENYASVADLSREDFQALKETPVEKRTLPETSLIYELYVQSGNETICYAVFAHGHVDQTAVNLDLERGVLVRIFREVEGTWKVETLSTGLWTDRLPFAELEKFIEGIQSGALIAPKGSYPQSFESIFGEGS